MEASHDSGTTATTTRWTTIIAVIQKGAGQDSEEAKRALERFCQHYYSVVRQFFIHRQCDEQEAQDLTQEFFEKKICSSYDSGEGFLFKVRRHPEHRFRSFLYTVLWGFFLDKQRHKEAVKSGGRAIHQPIEETDIPAMDGPMGLQFDRAFALDLIQKAIANDTRSIILFDYLRNTQVPEATARTEAADKLGVSAETFKVALHRFIQKLGELLRQAVSAYAGPEEEEIKEEIRHLVRCLT